MAAAVTVVLVNSPGRTTIDRATVPPVGSESSCPALLPGTSNAATDYADLISLERPDLRHQ